MSFTRFSALLTLLFVSFGLSACKTEPIKGPSTQAIFAEPLSLKPYSEVEIVPFQSQIEASEQTLATLFRMSRSALVNADCFKAINGLRRYASANTGEEKTVLITPTLISLDTQAASPSLTIRYHFQDKQTHASIGIIELTGHGGDAGLSSAMQRLTLAFQESIRLSVLGFN